MHDYNDYNASEKSSNSNSLNFHHQFMCSLSVCLSSPLLAVPIFACFSLVYWFVGNMMLRRVYKLQFVYQSIVYRSIFDYNSRNLYYTLTNSYFGQPDGTIKYPSKLGVYLLKILNSGLGGFWATNERSQDGTPRFPNGDYRVTGYACDIYSNCEQISHVVTVSN